MSNRLIYNSPSSNNLCSLTESMETLVKIIFNIIISMETFVLFMVTFVLMFLINWSCYTIANVNLCQKGKYKNPFVLAINGTELHCPLRRDVVCLPLLMLYPPFRNPWTLLRLDRGKQKTFFFLSFFPPEFLLPFCPSFFFYSFLLPPFLFFIPSSCLLLFILWF